MGDGRPLILEDYGNDGGNSELTAPTAKTGDLAASPTASGDDNVDVV